MKLGSHKSKRRKGQAWNEPPLTREKRDGMTIRVTILADVLEGLTPIPTITEAEIAIERHRHEIEETVVEHKAKVVAAAQLVDENVIDIEDVALVGLKVPRVEPDAKRDGGHDE